MKTGTVLVLVAFVAMATDMTCAQKPVPKRQQKPGTCPDTKGWLGICVELCSADWSCPHEMKCCSNGCGHICVSPVSEESDPGRYVKHGKDLDKQV